MKSKKFPILLCSLLVLVVIGFSLQGNKPTPKYNPVSNVAPGNQINLAALNNTEYTYNSKGGSVFNKDNILAYVNESFEGVTFPPTGWATVNTLGTNVWNRSTFLPHTGVACAFVNYESSGGEDWLLTPQFNVTAGDSISFWLALPSFVSFPPDSLAVRVSTTTQLPATIATYPTRLIYVADGAGYPGSTGTYIRLAASLNAFAGQNIYIAFRHGDLDGDGINIDDVSIGTPPANDVGTFSVDLGSSVPAGNVTPKATVRNYGSTAQTFPVTMTISGGYTNQQNVTSLPALTNQQVTFGTWTPTAGNYQVTVFTQLGSDVNRANDTLRSNVTVMASLTNCGWSNQTALTTGRATSANAFWRTGIAPNDTGFIYVITGANTSFTGIITDNARFNMRTNTWSAMAPIGLGRYHAQAVTARNKIYVIGGYNPNFTGVTNNDIYNPVSNTWSAGAPMPTGVGDYAIGVYNDSLIYCIGGYGNSADQNLVQIYNAISNTWSVGTVKPGAACSGLRGGIYGNKIVIAGGYSQTQGGNFDSAYVGTINVATPNVITWSANIHYPGGKMSRLAAGSPFGYDANYPYVFFTGGDSTGTGSTLSDRTWAYNVNTSSWLMCPAKPTKTNNFNNFIGVVRNDTAFMVNCGGWGGAAAQTVNEWLCLGPKGNLQGVSQNGSNIPNYFALSQNYPNPFNPSTIVKFALPVAGNVEVKIYDVLGNEVAVLVNEYKQAGYYSATFDGSALASGVYFYTIKSGSFSDSKKMLLVK